MGGLYHRDTFSVGDLEMTPAEFTCSRGARGKVNPAAQRLEKRPADVLPPNPDHDRAPRRLHLKQRDFLAHGTPDHCPGCRAPVSGSCGQGHTEEGRICVEGELRKAATRVGDAPTGGALKKVRFAGDRVDNSAEMPTGPQSVSASTLPAGIAPSSSGPTFAVCIVTDVPDQVMSEGASSSSNTWMKRSTDDCSNSESRAKQFHADRFMRDVVMLLDDSEVSQAVSQCREVCRDKGTFLVDVNDWDSRSRDSLRALGSDGTTVACSSSGATRELIHVKCVTTP